MCVQCTETGLILKDGGMVRMYEWYTQHTDVWPRRTSTWSEFTRHLCWGEI